MKNKKKNNKKILIIVGIVLLLVVGIVVSGIIIKKINVKDINKGENNNVFNQDIKVAGKLAEYIRGLTSNYYIKYSGNFKNNSGNTLNAIVEYTTNGKDFALRATNLGIELIYENDKLYSIVHNYKMIIEMNKESFDITEYNLVSDMGQTYVKSYNENIGSTTYDVEEYVYNGNTIKYYFKEKDIKLIRYNSEDIRIIRVEKNTNTELFVRPKGYSNI